MIDWLIALLLTLVSPAFAQNTETFQNYMSSRASAGSITGLNQLLILQNNQVKLGSVQGLGGILITSGITRAAIASSRIGGNIIVISGNTTAGDIGSNAIYATAGCTSGGLRAIADATGQFWCLQTPLGLPLPVGWFGAACDGVTNDATPIQLALTTGIANGIPVTVNGTCKIGATLTISSSVDFGGYNVQNDRILTTTSGFTALNITSAGPVNIHDLTVTGSATNDGIDVGTAAVQNVNSRFTNLDITNFGLGIHFVSAGGWNLSGSRIEGMPANSIPLVIENQFSPDGGDNEAWGNTFVCGSSGNAAVVWKSAGGLYFFGNKMLGSCTSNMLFNMSNGVQTSDILISNNSMEGSSSGAGIQFQRAGTTGNLFSVTIYGNEIVGGTNAILIPNDINGAWLHQLAITGNTMSGTPTPTATTGLVSIDSTTGLSLGYNAANPTVTADRFAFVGTGVNFAIVGPNICSVSSANACATSITSGNNVTTFVPF